MTRQLSVLIFATAMAMLVMACAPQPAPLTDSPEARAEQAGALADLEAAAGGYGLMLDEGAELAASATAQALVLELGREPNDEEVAAVEAIMRSALAAALTEEEWRQAVSGVYAEHLTAAELAEARAFYSSSTGQRLLGLGKVIDDGVVEALGSVLDAHEQMLAETIDGSLAERFPELVEEGSDD